MSEQAGVMALAYFQASVDYFWRWAEQGEVVEWADGTTICYREELRGVLKNLVDEGQGLPPLGSLLLLLAGCSSWATTQEEQLSNVRQGYTDFLDDTLLTLRLEGTVDFLRLVAALPTELRTGPPKQHLFWEVFNAKNSSDFKSDDAQTLVDEWTSGRLDTALQIAAPPRHWSKLLAELAPFSQAAKRFAEPGSLELLLRTGLDQLPAPLPEPPELPAPPAPASDSLFDQLLQDARTAGLAHLTQHLVAALRIPLQTAGASDRPLGGVADITNRGSFDRLLLSELAHDDLSLLARLANNEALYLRREEPPRPQARPRTILLDTTLRLWGTPRVFALAAALAWAYHAQQPRPAVAVSTYALGGQTCIVLDLSTFEGVVQALSQLDPARHCGPALQAFGRQVGVEATDCLLITEAQLVQQAGFSQLLATQPGLRFLLTVDREGTLELHEYVNGHRHLLHTTRYPLEELLFRPATQRQPGRPVPPGAGPAYLRQVPAPLFFPTTGLRMSAATTYYRPAIGVVGITETRRVLHWPSRATGARELLLTLELGLYCFGSDEASWVSILVSGEGTLRVYFFDLALAEVEMLDLTAELNGKQSAIRAIFRDNCYYVPRVGGDTLVFDCQQRVVRDRHNSLFPTTPPPPFRHEFNSLKRHVNSGYNVIHRIGRVAVNAAGELLVESHVIRLVSRAATLTHHLQLVSGSETDANPTSQATPHDLTDQPPAGQMLTRRFTWPTGSEALLDNRGLLHLRSADASVPEITLLLVIGQPTAAWAADGTVCGSDYFTGPDPAHRLPAEVFYEQYLRRFTASLA